jgi:hypothetical protein
VLLLEEDTNTTHYQLITKFFLAEGAGCGHSVMVASVGEKEDAGEKGLISELPSVHVSQAEAEKEKQEESTEVLKIFTSTRFFSFLFFFYNRSSFLFSHLPLINSILF